MIISVVPLPSAMVPSSSEHPMTTIKVMHLVRVPLPEELSQQRESSWTQVAKLTADDGGRADAFGTIRCNQRWYHLRWGER